jgi:D-3-phosphoglycerate dehydrogenase
LVADTALQLGMDVMGYDPALSVDAAWRLPREVRKIDNLVSLFAKADYITLHLPVLESTRGLINKDLLAHCKADLRLLNFSREEIVDVDAIVDALNLRKLHKYITDFPAPGLIGRSDVVLMPHIGASTDEAEENCAVMAADQLRNFLENGNISNSVNFPTTALDRNGGVRLAITNRNIPKMLGQLLSVLADADINVIDMINKSRDDVAYNLIDVAAEPSAEFLQRMRAVTGVVNVRLIR